jgi:hypothetical protein
VVIGLCGEDSEEEKRRIKRTYLGVRVFRVGSGAIVRARLVLDLELHLTLSLCQAKGAQSQNHPVSCPDPALKRGKGSGDY